MKKTFFVFLLSTSAVLFSQESIQFEKDNFAKILEKAKKQNKLIFLDAYASWCGPCKMMDKNIFTKNSVKEYYNAHFINAKIDMDKGEGVTIAKKYNVRAYPTYLFINGKGEVVHKAVGYFEENQFLDLGKNAQNPNNNIEAIKKRFDEGESNPEFLKNIINTNYSSDYDFAKKASERYFNTKKNPDISKDEVGILMFFTQSPNDANYQYFIKNKNEIIKILPEDKYLLFDNQVKLSGIIKNAIDFDKKIIKEEYFITESSKIVGKEEATKALNKLKLNFYLKEKKYTEYEKTALEYYKNPALFDANELNSVAWNFFQKIDRPESLNIALEWAKESIKKEQASHNTDTLANLYHKLGDKTNAILWAEKSIELAKAKGEEFEETQKLLNTLKKK